MAKVPSSAGWWKRFIQFGNTEGTWLNRFALASTGKYGTAKMLGANALIFAPGIAGASLLWYGAYNLFSGKDDSYNTVEGLKHGGFSERKRRELTHFGSGLIRELFGSMSKFIAAPKGEAFKRLTGYMKQAGVSVIKEDPLSFFGPATIGVSSTVVSVGTGATIQSGIFFHRELAQASFARLAGSAAGYKSVAGTLLWHEAAESHYVRLRFAKGLAAKRVPGTPLPQEAISSLQREAQSTGFGSHVSPGVIVEELMMGAKSGPKAYGAIKALRQGEISRMLEDPNIAVMSYLENPSFGGLRRIVRSARAQIEKSPSLKEMMADQTVFQQRESIRQAIRGAANPQMQQMLRQQFGESLAYAKRVQKITETFERKWLPKFPEFQNVPKSGKPFNPIKGHAEDRGQAALRQDLTTDFKAGGSWNPFSAIKRAAGWLRKTATGRATQRTLWRGPSFGRPGLIKLAPELSEPMQSVMRDVSLMTGGIGTEVAGQTFKMEHAGVLLRELEQRIAAPELGAFRGFAAEVASAQRRGLKQFAFVDPKMVAQEANRLGVSTDRLIASSGAHEVGHNAITELGVRKHIASLPVHEREFAQWQKTGVGAQYTSKYAETDPGMLKEEFLMAVLEGRVGGRRKWKGTEKVLRKWTKKAAGGQIANDAQFSGFDDVSNLVEAFQEGGMSGFIRKLYGFGSGWRGILKLPSSMSRVVKEGKESLRRATALNVKGHIKLAEKHLGARAKVIGKYLEQSTPGASLPEHIKTLQKEWDEWHDFYVGLQEAKQAGFKDIVGVSREFLEKARYSDVKRSILHERGHIGISLKTGKTMSDPSRMAVPVPERVSYVLGKIGYSPSQIAEEAAVRMYSYTKVPKAGATELKWATKMPYFVRQGEEAANLAYTQKMKLMRKWYNAHKMGVVRVSRMSKQGARGHLKKTGAMPH